MSIPIRAFVQQADMDPILKVAQSYKLIVFEDACEAIGAEYESCKAGRTLRFNAVFTSTFIVA